MVWVGPDKGAGQADVTGPKAALPELLVQLLRQEEGEASDWPAQRGSFFLIGGLKWVSFYKEKNGGLDLMPESRQSLIVT